jgi:hypothetical protein
MIGPTIAGKRLGQTGRVRLPRRAVDACKIRGRHPGRRAASIPGISATPDPLNHAESAWLQGAIWARQDSNLGDTD